MSDVEIPIKGEDPGPPIPLEPPRKRRRGGNDGTRPAKPRVRKRRVLAVLLGLGVLAAISTIYGVLMAVASDIPQIENRQQYKLTTNSFLYDDHWRPIGVLAPPNQPVIDDYGQISPWMRRAIVSVEDKRFWSDPGVDLKGIARAFVSDVSGGPVQGGSTISQQFVKNALSEENNRTVLEKLREAAIAYHLTRKWRPQKILTEYLNTIYFGNGAYGVESAARVYFGKVHGFDPGATAASGGACGDSTPTAKQPKCAELLTPAEAATLAGMVANPTAFDPLAHPRAATGRRNLVLRDMFQQHYLTRTEYERARSAPLPTANDIQHPSEPAVAPYFTSWLRPQLLGAVERGGGVSPSVAEYRTFYGGLKIRTTLDLKLQQAAEQAISSELPSGVGLPTASLVAIDNKTGEVRAMVGGAIVNGREDYTHSQFNLATQGLRQPGSSFKPFTLAVALQHGYSPYSVINSAPQDFIVPNSGGKEHFVVHNFGNAYSGPISLAARHRRLGQLRVRAGGHQRRHASDRRHGARDGDPHPGVEQLRDDPRRPQDRGQPARHGARVRDVRHRWQPRLQPRARRSRPGADGDRRDPVSPARVPCRARHRPSRLPPGAASERRRHGPRHAHRSRPERHGHPSRDPGGRRRRQDGDDDQLRRCLVRGLDAADHGRRLGRLSEQARLDEHPVQRRAGGGRDLPRHHLAQLRNAGAPGSRHRIAPEPEPVEQQLEQHGHHGIGIEPHLDHVGVLRLR